MLAQRILSVALILVSLTGCDPARQSTGRLRPEAEEASSDVAMEDRAHEIPADEQTVAASSDMPNPTTASDLDPDAIRILAWNIESGGADIDVIASQLEAMPRYDVYGFTEVDRDEWPKIKDALGESYTFWYSYSGYKDRTAFAFRNDRFDLIRKYEMKEYEEAVMNPGNYRSPHVHELHDQVTDTEMVLMLNHLARGDAAIRQEQARAIRLWAAKQTKPVVAIGDYNFDYVFATKKGNPAFDVFMSDGVFEWVVPDPLVDSNWFDGDGDGKDDYPGSILDFCFVAGPAKSWNPKSQVIVRERDFPDDEKTSDHRPVELVLNP